MKHIFIIGARGYHYNYGGWETFVSNFVDNYNDKNTMFHISEVSSKKIYEKKHSDNVIVDYFKIKQNGSAQMLLCTIKAFNYYLKYIQKNNIKNSYIYVLGLKLGPMLKLKRNKIKKLGITILVNPDGLEHERSKWGYFVKKFFLFSEKTMLKNSDVIVCDAKGIKKYIDKKYPILRNKTIYIAYGVNHIKLSDTDEKKTLNDYNLKPNDYFLMVGRFVPENNYELIINDFIQSKTIKKLVIVSNISNSDYYDKIVAKTNCINDKRIIFIDGIYDQKKLAIVRKNALAYIHGHSVGGTNPSLLEALNFTNINILYDVEFNKDIGKSACLYFNNNRNSLTKIIDNIDKYDGTKMGNECKQIIKDNFTWKIIVDKYKKIFR